METWFSTDTFSPHSELNLFPVLPDPRFCSPVAHSHSPCTGYSSVHRFTCPASMPPPEKFPKHHNLECVLEMGGLK